MRLKCLVPFCGHSRGDRRGQSPNRPGMEWICGDHWRLTDRRTRLLLFRVRRKMKRFGPDHLLALHSRLWVKLRTQAIERAAGL